MSVLIYLAVSVPAGSIHDVGLEIQIRRVQPGQKEGKLVELSPAQLDATRELQRVVLSQAIQALEEKDVSDAVMHSVRKLVSVFTAPTAADAVGTPVLQDAAPLSVVSERFGVNVKTLQRWLATSRMTPSRSAADKREKLLTPDQIEELERRYLAHSRRGTRGRKRVEARPVPTTRDEIRQEIDTIKDAMTTLTKAVAAFKVQVAAAQTVNLAPLPPYIQEDVEALDSRMQHLLAQVHEAAREDETTYAGARN